MNDPPPKLRLTDDADRDLDIARRDEGLIRGLLAGDPAALDRLIDHYDRLVRFTVFRSLRTECTRDPTCLDARASEVWTGFVDSIQRRASGPDGTVQAYLARIARNKCNDFLRAASKTAAEKAPGDPESVDLNQAPAPDADPLAALIGFEQIETLRACMADLTVEDRKLLQELDLVTNARWSEAAERLKMPESTLRSRWDRLLRRLRAALEKKDAEKS